jgi:poly(hydroxyalkanoate) granule-associated protein
MSTTTIRKDGRAQALQGSVEQVWLAGLGALALTEEEGSKFFHSLVKKGEVVERRSKARLEDVMDAAKRVPAAAINTIERRTDETFQNVIKRLGIPTRRDIDLLTRRIEKLTAAPAPKPRTRRAPASRTARRTASAATVSPD